MYHALEHSPPEYISVDTPPQSRLQTLLLQTPNNHPAPYPDSRQRLHEWKAPHMAH